MVDNQKEIEQCSYFWNTSYLAYIQIVRKILNLLKRDPLKKETIAASLIWFCLVFGVNPITKFVTT
jgi:hypothetical protein